MDISRMKRLIVCADDYGLNPDVSAGILELARNHCITAITCMTNRPNWVKAAKDLATLHPKTEIGLHFNLTEGEPLTDLPPQHFTSLFVLITRAYTHRLKKSCIKAELSAQLDAFIQHTGKLPDFIDGHQHIHQLPVIRDALVELYRERLMEKRPYIRVPSNPWRKTLRELIAYPKLAIIAVLGGFVLRARLERFNIPHNHYFSGAYTFSPSADYPQLFPRFLRQAGADGIIMCHPAKPSPQTPNTPLAHCRVNEFEYLRKMRP
jgi:chitin disaccharide deacetylase